MPTLILTSFAKKLIAANFAKKLIAAKLVACCSILPATTAVYRWKGKINVAQEVQLLIKTTPSRRSAVEKFIGENHPYELPEILILSAGASKKFGSWIEKEVR